MQLIDEVGFDGVSSTEKGYVMNNSKLRGYIRDQNRDLAARADTFWREAEPVIKRQDRPDSNENGQIHVEAVERNIWKLLNDSSQLTNFNINELFLLSCGACCHDFDKGLFANLPDDIKHGVGSGDFIVGEFRVFLRGFHDANVIRQIIGLHDLKPADFRAGVRNLRQKLALTTAEVHLQKLAVLLKTADILHTDSSRIPKIGVNVDKLDEKAKKKYLARKSISGWRINGSRIVFDAVPEDNEHLEALDGCIKFITEKEWPSVKDKLGDYGFPYELEFDVDKEYCTPDSSENGEILRPRPKGLIIKPQKLYESKLIIVGEPGAGKTSLMKKLLDPKYPIPRPDGVVEESTIGIDVVEGWTFDHPHDKNITFKANLWDFGGQEIQYMTHQFFLTPGALYVLVADDRKHHTNFPYWFQIINLLGKGTDYYSPVLVVLNENKHKSITGT